MELTILLPCLNEERTIKVCVEKALFFLKENKIHGEVLVVDNNSIDNSVIIAKTSKARVVINKTQGYGATIRKGIKEARGKYIIMADSDDSYDLDNLYPFYIELKKGYDLVMGNRFKGGLEKDSMKFSHKIGNFLLTKYANILYKSKIGDYHCGLRAFNKEKINKLNLETNGMEFASEIIIKCIKNKYLIKEIPTRLFKDGRNRKSHLRTYKDGLRHLLCITKYYFVK